MDCLHARIASAIKMAILNHANHLPLNLQMGNLLLGTIINFLIAILKMFYILICHNCDYFYLGKTIDFKQRIRKHKSDVKHPLNSTCRECAEHLRDCAKIEPFFRFICFIMRKIIILETTKKNDLLLNGSHH